MNPLSVNMADNTINHAAYNAIDLMLDTADNMTLSQLLFVYQSIEVKLRDKGWTQ